MAAGGHQAPADEDHRAELVDGGQLADGVEDDDVGARLGVDRQVAAPRRAEALLLAQLHHLGEALRVARRDQQQGRGQRRLDATEDPQDHRFLALHGAAGDQHRPGRREAEIAQDAFARPRRRGGSARLQRVELEAAGDDDAIGGGADLDEAADRLLRLHAESVDVSEHVPEEAARQPVARERPRRQPAVHDRGLDATGSALAQQVRPDLGLHHQEQARLHQVQGAAYDQPEVEGKVEDGIGVGHAAAGQLLCRHRRRRHEEPQPGMALAQGGDERAGGQQLADRHGVDPDRRLGVDVERYRQVTKTLRQAGDVLAITHRLIEEPRRDDDREEDDEGGVEGVHLFA